MDNENEIMIAVDEIFETYDTDKSGYLEEGETILFFKDLFGTCDKIDKEAHKLALADVDDNKDGKLSKEELKVILINAMADGSLDLDCCDSSDDNQKD